MIIDGLLKVVSESEQCLILNNHYVCDRYMSAHCVTQLLLAKISKVGAHSWHIVSMEGIVCRFMYVLTVNELFLNLSAFGEHHQHI